MININEWSVDSIGFPGGSRLFASDFLNDTTLSNPTLLDFLGFEMTFYLKVEDSLGAKCYDTLKLTSTEFLRFNVTYSFKIFDGDSIQLKSPDVVIAGNMPRIDSILWRPNHGLIDSNAINPWAKPSRDIIYYATIWDEYGCSQQGVPFQYVDVEYIGIDEANQFPIEVFPTILSSEKSMAIHIDHDHTGAFLKIIDVLGKEIYSEKLLKPFNQITLPNLTRGIYCYAILNGNTPLKKGNIIIQ